MNKRRFTQKISNRRGATLLIALLVFLIAALSGTIALTMAASNAGRYAHEKDDQQAYLSAASAAKLILNKLGSVSIEYKSKEKSTPHSADDIDITYYGPDYTPDTPGSSIGDAEAGMFFADSRFKEMLKTFSLNSATDTAVIDPIFFTLTVPDATEMGQVYVKLSLQGAEFAFYLYSMRGESRDYQMTMRVNASFDKDGTGSFIQRPDEKGQLAYFYRVMTFSTANATFAVEKLTEGTGGAGK